jgi:beta-lactamase class A
VDGGGRHDAALVFPADAPPDTLVVCTSGLADVGPLIRDVAAAGWAARHDLGGRPAADDTGWRPDARR